MVCGSVDRSLHDNLHHMETCILGLEGIMSCLVFEFMGPIQSSGKYFQAYFVLFSFMGIIYRYPISYVKFEINLFFCGGTCFDP